MAGERRRGRQSRYTAEIVGRIAWALGLGATHSMAARCGPIGLTTFYRWRRCDPGPLRFEGRPTPALLELQEQTEGMSFSEIVDHYEARAVVMWLAKIEAAIDSGDWKAAIWKLERCFPEDFGPPVRRRRPPARGGGPNRAEVGPRPLDLSGLSPAETADLETILAKPNGAGAAGWRGAHGKEGGE